MPIIPVVIIELNNPNKNETAIVIKHGTKTFFIYIVNLNEKYL